MKKTDFHSRKSQFVWIALSISLAILGNQLYLRYRSLDIIPYSYHESISDTDSSYSQLTTSQSNAKTYPVLEIPKLGRALPVTSSNIVDGVWETSPTSLSHAGGSPEPGEGGNSVIYGHNWPNMLLYLPTLVPGDIIYAHLSDTRRITYTVSATAIVEPHDLSLTLPTDDSRLTLYTCTGLLDQQRFVVVAHQL